MREEELQLFIECGSNGPTIADCHIALSLNESSTSTHKGLTKFRGKFQEAETVNKNKRSYPFSVLKENVDMLMESIGERGLVGELDHPTDSIVHFEKASHVITKLWWENNILMGEGEILTTAAGETLKALLECGVRIGISSRGVGSGRADENGILVIGENYKLITFDAVADPSTKAAYQKKVTTKENYIPQKNVIKNETNSIYKVNKDKFLNCVGEGLSTKTSNIKARLN